MRRFLLHTRDRAQTLDLNTAALLATEPRGLGNTFAVAYKETDTRRYPTSVTPSFEPISFKIYFNADGGDGYASYKRFCRFLTLCGKRPFLLEYDDGVTDKLCDVLLRSHTKSEIDEDGVLCETLTLERTSYWYEWVQTHFSLETLASAASAHPMRFPLGFVGRRVVRELTVTNPFFEAAPVRVLLCGGIAHPTELTVTDENGEQVAFLRVMQSVGVGERIVIDPDEKRVTHVAADGTETNAYDLTDKRGCSFLWLPQGRHRISCNLTGEDGGRVELSVKRYLLD